MIKESGDERLTVLGRTRVNLKHYRTVTVRYHRLCVNTRLIIIGKEYLDDRILPYFRLKVQ